MSRSFGAVTPLRYVHRRRLSALLDHNRAATVVVGSAGSGKTTAVAGWARDQDRPVVWVDASDFRVEPRSLWPAIANSFGAEVDESGAGPAPVGDVVYRLIDALASTLQRDHILVIDNFDQVDSVESAVAVGLLLRHCPQRLRLVVMSRRSFVIGASVASGRVDEVSVEDLRFTVSESAALVRLIAPRASAAFVNLIVTEADGWGVALALGASLRHDDRDENDVRAAFDRAMRRYVLRELLAAEEPDMVDFLVDIAIVDRVTAPLADAIAERGDSAHRFEQAEDRGLLVSQLGIRGWYEIHAAVRRALVHEAERRDPTRVVACRRRAAAWLEDAGETVPALEQWIAAHDDTSALRLIGRRDIELCDAGLDQAIRELVDDLARRVPTTDVPTMLDLACCEVLVDRAGFLRRVDEAQWLAQRTDVAVDARRRLQALGSLAALITGDLERCTTEALAALHGHPAWWNDPIVTSTWNAVARSIALDERWDEASAPVREITVVLHRQPERAVVLDATRALGEALAGRPIDALRIAAGVRVTPTIDSMAFSSGEVALAEVVAHREIGDAAHTAVEMEALVEIESVPITYVRVIAAHELVQLHLDRSALADAGNAFDRFERLVIDEFPGGTGRSWLGRMGTVFALEDRDVVRAKRWAETVDDPFWARVSLARIAAASGDRDSVRQSLDGARPRSPRHEVMILLMRAASAETRETATDLAETAAKIAAEHNMLQTVVSARQLDLIERVAWRLPETWMDRLRRASTAGSVDRAHDVTLIEPLTAREEEVLRYLPSRLTLREIAAELYVSVNTLKFHLKVIYRKLGVNSRAEAADVARGWGRIHSR